MVEAENFARYLKANINFVYFTINATDFKIRWRNGPIGMRSKILMLSSSVVFLIIHYVKRLRK